jgi:hypothetical protein
MTRDETHGVDTLPSTTLVCARCDHPLRYFMIDGEYCSYECAGLTMPDSRDHPASCWTWDGKPKMGFPTRKLAEAMCTTLAIPGVVAYACPLHHFWHVGYSDGRSNSTTTGVP